MKTVKLNSKKYKIKLKLRGFMLFEEMANKSVNEITNRLPDMLKLFYCTVKANNRDEFDMTFDEFIDALEDNPQELNIFTELYNSSTGESNQDTPKKK